MSSRVSRVTTKSGDSGQTRLATGEVYEKSNDQIELVGILDEANCALGVLVQYVDREFIDDLKVMQARLFDIGAAIAMNEPQQGWDLQTEEVTEKIRTLNSTLPLLTEFILPGGSNAAAFAHVARASVRRAERAFWRSATHQLRESGQGAYLNRVSDYLFVLARKITIEEETWQPMPTTKEKT